MVVVAERPTPSAPVPGAQLPGRHLDGLREWLLKRGIHVHPIIYPAVSETMARLRFFVTNRHSEEQLLTTVDALAEELARLNPAYLAAV